MKNITRTQYQAFPFHLVEPSPWPILTSFALLTLTVSAVLYFHDFVNGGELLTLGFILVSGGMVLGFRDVIVEGTKIIAIIASLIFIVYTQLIECEITSAVLILQSFVAPIKPADDEPGDDKPQYLTKAKRSQFFF